MSNVGDAITIGVTEGAKFGKQLIVSAKGRPANLIAAGIAASFLVVSFGAAYGVKHMIESRSKKGELPEPR